MFPFGFRKVFFLELFHDMENDRILRLPLLRSAVSLQLNGARPAIEQHTEGHKAGLWGVSWSQ